MYSFDTILNCFTQLIFLLVITLLISLAIISILLRLKSSPVATIIRYESEKQYLDANTGSRHRFPSLVADDASIYLSVIIPAYNEEIRLPNMLDEAIDYLNKRSDSDHSFAYEIIIVDDGSTDNTTQVALSYSKKYGVNKIRVLTLEKNRGKGGAVRLGMLSSRGEWLLFADADGATRFADYEKLDNFMIANAHCNPPPIAIGSRAHLEEQSIATRSIFRTILMYGFHSLVYILTVRTIKDTQCGFKLFRRDIARVLFANIHVERWAFDVELLLIAERLNCKIAEIAVNWTEIEGSKVVPFWSWLQMGADVTIISLKYAIGACRIPVLDKERKKQN